MAGAKETPRQKMIGMMYLVLTAMLALNVSKDILDAFVVVNEGMVSTNESLSTKIASEYAKFESQYELNKSKVEEHWNKAQEVRQKSFEMVQYLNTLKRELVANAEKVSVEEVDQLYGEPVETDDPFNYGKKITQYKINLNKVASKDNYDAPTNYLIGNETGKVGKSVELIEKMKEYRNYIINIVGEEHANKIGLVTDGQYQNASGLKQDWAQFNFYHTILAADITIINKIIGEVQTAEFDAVNQLFRRIDAKDFKFDNICARVIPKTTYILQGQTYEAEVIVAAYDSKTQSEVKYIQGVAEVNDRNIANAKVIQSSGGTVKLQFQGAGQGIQRYAGVVEVRDPVTQEINHYPFSEEYIVAPPALTVAPTKMNVFYAGVKNPISISAPGIPSEKIVPSISNGKLNKDSNGEYYVEVTSDQKETVISAVAKMDDKNVSLGSFTFRIKRVPNPVAKIAGQTEGTIDKSRLLAAGAIIPELEDFEFADFHFQITSYELSTTKGGDLQSTGTIRTNAFNDVAKGFINNASRGQKLYFEKIQAKGPDGSSRSLGSIILEIK